MSEVRERWTLPFRPNGLHADADGLWVMAQSGGEMTDNHVYKVRYEDGTVMERVPTGLGHAGGVTVGGGYVWVAADHDIFKLDHDGNILETHMAPGGRGAHGLHWVDDDNMWIVDPGAFRVDLVDPHTMGIKRSVPTPIGRKAHGMFVDGEYIWQGVTRKDTGGGELYRIHVETGDVLRRIDVPEPEVHGLAGHDGDIWICCAKTNRVCTVAME